MKRWILGIITTLLLVMFTACGSANDDEQTGEEQVPSIDISEDEKMTDDEVVVLVNNNEVYGDRYNIIYPQIKMYATQMEDDVELDAIEERTIDALIDQELIYQGAEKEGIIVTDDEVEERFAELKEENEEGLNSLLEQFHMTEEAFKDQLMFEVTMEQFVDLMVDVEVTDEEVESYYNEAKEENEQMPDLSDVKDQLKAQLLKEKTDDAFEEIIVEMKEEAKIEKKI